MSEQVTTREDMTEQVRRTVQDYPDDFDVPAIVSEIVSVYGLVSINVIDAEPYWDIVKRHDIAN